MRWTINIAGWQIQISGIKWKTWNRMAFLSVCMTNNGGHTVKLQRVDLLLSTFRLIKTLKLKSAIMGFSAESVTVSNRETAIKENETHNPTSSQWEHRLYAISKLFNGIFRFEPNNISIGKITLQAGSFGLLMVEDFKLVNSFVSGRISLAFKQFSATVPFSGKIYKDETRIDLHSSHLALSHKNVECITGSACKLSLVVCQPSLFNITIAANEIKIDHPSFSRSSTVIETATADLDLFITPNKFELSPESEVSINGIPMLIQVLHETQQAELLKFMVIFIIEGPKFFRTYPFFNNTGLTGIQAQGERVIRLTYMLSLANFREYYFKSDILQDTFQATNLGPFIQNNQYIAKISGREDNSNYIGLEDMPKHLIDVVINAEDPTFYKHCGVDPYYIGLAAAYNLRKGRFKRGASTITMQLCKNIFFYNDRCITRKIDEMIVAWLCEKFLPLSKQQILELYLNIIDFADGIQGIKSAAKYYFNKEVAGLTLLQSIVMAYIIPRPKFFLEAVLMRSPQLMTNLHKHIGYQLQTLQKQGKVTDEIVAAIEYKVEFELQAFENKKITLTW